MVIVRGTRKFLTRLSGPVAAEAEVSTALLGDWYATVLPWRPCQVALRVSETTLLPVMLPMAPSSTVLTRFPSQLAAVLRQHRVDEAMIVQECSSTVDYRLSTTANRSLLGSMNEFIHLARDYRQDPDLNLIDLSMQLSTVPCGPLFGRHVSPNREVHAVIQSARP